MDMPQEERRKEAVEEITETEKQFLKDLYVFMKKRNTPIERIPNLGFKQIDLYVMFKTVKELGGYHQVTAQQLWKHVYNRLGGNPRSTSAATCTRRHYEKLLLPYECHVKGVQMNILPHHQQQQQQKPFTYSHYINVDDDGQRPAKRQLLSMCQDVRSPLSDQHGSAFLLSLPYPRYHHPGHPVLPPHVPITSSVLAPHSPPAPHPRFSFEHYRLSPAETVKEPLEHLRYLAERYKTSSGLSEPLNLSVKGSKWESSSSSSNSTPASSFAPPSSSKNPKFLNKPFPLYNPHCPQVVREDKVEAPNGEAHLGDAPYSHPVKVREPYVIDLEASSSLTLRVDEGATTPVQSPSSSKTDFTTGRKEDREGSPDVRGLSLSHLLPGIPRENRGEMEIEVPLSVFHKWMKLCRSSATMHGDKQLPTFPYPEENSGQRSCSDAEALLTGLTFGINPLHHSLVAEDLRLRQRNLPSPTPTTQTTGSQYNPFTSCKPLPSGSILKNAASQDVFPFDKQDIYEPYSSKPQNCWDAFDQDQTHDPTVRAKSDTNPLTVQRNFAALKSFNEDSVQGGREKPETGSSAVLMMNSSPASVLHLTTEEVLKLKKIISSSS